MSRVQSGLATKVEKASRKLRKERKNRSKKVRGTSKAKAGEVSFAGSSWLAVLLSVEGSFNSLFFAPPPVGFQEEVNQPLTPHTVLAA